MIFKSALLTSASGSLGGITASHNKGGLYLRARAIPTNPSTAFQVIVRSAVGTLANRWVNVLTQVQRDAWDVYAFNTPLIGPLGDPRTVSGLDMYIRSNAPRIQSGTTTIDDGPTVFTLGTFTPVTVTSMSAITQNLILNFDILDIWNTTLLSGLQVYISRPQNTSINYFKGPYRFSLFQEGAVIPPVPPAVAPVPFVVVAGQKLFFRVTVTEVDGRLSTSQFGSTVVTA